MVNIYQEMAKAALILYHFTINRNKQSNQ